jgi:protein transport protein SEC31
MKLKEIERSATVAWCPRGGETGLLAAGAVAGAIDLEFSSSAQLELLSFGLGTAGWRCAAR